MPRRPNNRKDTSQIFVKDECCFCQRPADTSVAFGLADLTTSSGAVADGKPLQFHEACAGYSNVIARANCPHGGIPGWQVRNEFNRGRNVLCATCRKPGATLSCKSFASCKKSYHVPCAREAAMAATLAHEDSDKPVFSSSVREVACAEHSSLITRPLDEPAGIWFEAYGGWDDHCEEAAAEWQRQQQALERPGSARPGSAAAGAQRGSTSIGAVGGGGEQTTPSAGVTNAAATALASPSPSPAGGRNFDIPGYIWEASACIQGDLPPLRPGEGRVLGVTMSAPVHAAAQRVMTTFAGAQDASSLRPVVVLHATDSTFTPSKLKNVQSSVLKALCKLDAGGKFQVDGNSLPRAAPTHPSLEAFRISKDDARVGLAADPDAMGVRVRTDAKPIKAFELLGFYGGLQLFTDDYNRLVKDASLARRLGLRSWSQLSTTMESYSADEEQLGHVPLTQEELSDVAHIARYAGPFPEARFARELLGGRCAAPTWLITSAFLYGNITCLINDPTLDPFAAPAKASARPTPAASRLIAEPNCEMVVCLVRGWPFVVLVSTKPIALGAELLYMYDSSATGSGYWHNLREHLEAERKTLKELEESELEKEKLRAEKEELMAQIRAAQEALAASKASEQLARAASGIQRSFRDDGEGSAALGSGAMALTAAAAAAPKGSIISRLESAAGSEVVGQQELNIDTPRDLERLVSPVMTADLFKAGGGGGGNDSGSAASVDLLAPQPPPQQHIPPTAATACNEQSNENTRDTRDTAGGGTAQEKSRNGKGRGRSISSRDKAKDKDEVKKHALPRDARRRSGSHSRNRGRGYSSRSRSRSRGRSRRSPSGGGGGDMFPPRGRGGGGGSFRGRYSPPFDAFGRSRPPFDPSYNKSRGGFRGGGRGGRDIGGGRFGGGREFSRGRGRGRGYEDLRRGYDQRSYMADQTRSYNDYPRDLRDLRRRSRSISRSRSLTRSRSPGRHRSRRRSPTPPPPENKEKTTGHSITEGALPKPPAMAMQVAMSKSTDQPPQEHEQLTPQQMVQTAQKAFEAYQQQPQYNQELAQAVEAYQWQQQQPPPPPPHPQQQQQQPEPSDSDMELEFSIISNKPKKLEQITQSPELQVQLQQAVQQAYQTYQPDASIAEALRAIPASLCPNFLRPNRMPSPSPRS